MNDFKQQIRIAAVVCTYQIERYDRLLACLKSLHEQTLPISEIIVVVDGNADVRQALERRGGSERIMALPRNSGLSAARNAGIAAVRADWIAFLDDDAIADARWLEHLGDACNQLGTVGAGGWSIPDFGRTQPRWLPDELLWTVGCSHRSLPTERAVVRNVFGGCAMFSASLFRLVGGFDIRLGRVGANAAGGEEAEFCNRVVKADPTARFAHVPGAIIRHRVSLERLTPWYTIRRCYQDGKAKAGLGQQASKEALAPERNFVAKVAPRGVALSFRERRPQAGLVLIAGVSAAAVGFLHGNIIQARSKGRLFRVREVTIETNEELPLEGPPFTGRTPTTTNSSAFS